MSEEGTMKALLYDEKGGIEVMKVAPRPKPTPGPRDVLVHMKGAGLNPVDFKVRDDGIFSPEYPVITGWDVAGTVAEVGSDVKDWKVGDEVYAYNRPAFDGTDEEKMDEPKTGVEGCAAEYVIVRDWKLSRKPKNMSFAEAGGVPLAALTAHQAIFEKGGLKEGQTLLVLNASGGVGSFAVQFAVASGFKVAGTGSSRSADFIKSLGAACVDYTKGDVASQVKAVPGFEDGVDVIFDCIGGDDGLVALELVKDSGIIVSIANWSIDKQAEEKGKKGVAFLVSVSGKRLAEITDLIEAGKAKTAKLTTFPLEQGVEAFKQLETNRTKGKIVLTNE